VFARYLEAVKLRIRYFYHATCAALRVTSPQGTKYYERKLPLNSSVIRPSSAAPNHSVASHSRQQSEVTTRIPAIKQASYKQATDWITHQLLTQFQYATQLAEAGR
jgi:hypothetical protein